jgi:hypothetical protein
MVQHFLTSSVRGISRLPAVVSAKVLPAKEAFVMTKLQQVAGYCVSHRVDRFAGGMACSCRLSDMIGRLLVRYPSEVHGRQEVRMICPGQTSMQRTSGLNLSAKLFQISLHRRMSVAAPPGR